MTRLAPSRHPTAILPEARTLIDLLLPVPRDLAAAAGFELAAPNDVIKFMWQIARNRDLIEDLRPEHMEEARSRLSSDPEIALTCFVSGTMPRDDATRPSEIPSSRTCTGSRKDRTPCQPLSRTVTASSARSCRSTLIS